MWSRTLVALTKIAQEKKSVARILFFVFSHFQEAATENRPAIERKNEPMTRIAHDVDDAAFAAAVDALYDEHERREREEYRAAEEAFAADYELFLASQVDAPADGMAEDFFVSRAGQ